MIPLLFILAVIIISSSFEISVACLAEVSGARMHGINAAYNHSFF